MTAAAFRRQDQKHYLISGAIIFSTVPELLRTAMSVITGSGDSPADRKSVVDMSQVTECNSAALALIFEIKKQAGHHGVEISFDKIPSSLMTIAKAYGVEREIREFSR